MKQGPVQEASKQEQELNKQEQEAYTQERNREKAPVVERMSVSAN